MKRTVADLVQVTLMRATVILDLAAGVAASRGVTRIRAPLVGALDQGEQLSGTIQQVEHVDLLVGR